MSKAGQGKKRFAPSQPVVGNNIIAGEYKVDSGKQITAKVGQQAEFKQSQTLEKEKVAAPAAAVDVPGIASLSLAHLIGFKGDLTGSLWLHPTDNQFITVAGANVVVTSVDNPSNQSFLTGHDAAITCLSVSKSVRRKLNACPSR